MFWRAAKSAPGEPQESSTRGPGGPQEDPREADRKVPGAARSGAAQEPPVQRSSRESPGGAQERPRSAKA